MYQQGHQGNNKLSYSLNTGDMYQAVLGVTVLSFNKFTVHRGVTYDEEVNVVIRVLKTIGATIKE